MDYACRKKKIKNLRNARKSFPRMSLGKNKSKIS